MLTKLKKEGITIVVSTPYMDEANLCDRIALIQGGKIMAIDTPVKITESFTKDLLAIRTENIYSLLTELREYPDVHSVYPFGQFVHYTDKKDKPDIIALEDYLIKKGHAQIEINKINPGVEDCFMEMMKTE